MNNQNSEQITYPAELIKGKEKLLEDEVQIILELVDEKQQSVKFPKNIKEIKSSDAVVKGQTASSISFKNAVTNKNSKILHLHIKEGDKVLISSETLNYVEKAKD